MNAATRIQQSKGRRRSRGTRWRQREVLTDRIRTTNQPPGNPKLARRGTASRGRKLKVERVERRMESIRGKREVETSRAARIAVSTRKGFSLRRALALHAVRTLATQGVRAD